MDSGRVVSIGTAAEQGAPIESRERVEAVADAGIRRDRYFDDEGTFGDRDGSDLTLIEREALEAVEDDYDIAIEQGAHRRNVTTTGVALNHLVDEEFRIGDVVCLGVELCEPCSFLEGHLEKRGVRDALVHRGGLRARILEGGTIEVGSAVAVDP
ncbi:MOSC domain-containing protein [Halostagnicola sp. A-GB9-2]|uniref:MOSC domain-containing protein n=1 Tax=Halostagnicola sp. A-GB9-2 TaxID=3048066 RepID=UPI0024BF54B6|nr:MOSC domain-containing protein [Halostagnicola sp. A-GB9-2]MDJ1431387.1 MOSC domain-containing protein [Halostagnicola sp. A-GB9-2]